MDYIEVCMEITPFKEEYAELVIAMTDEVGFESFSVEAPYLKGYIPQKDFSAHRLKCVLSYFDNGGDFGLSYTYSLIPSQNWNRIWEANFDPIVIGNLCTVKAGFHKGLPLTKYNIRIDPKMAFGTGHHQTTSLMIRTMLQMKFRGKQVLDMGTGTGILAILAAKMGAGRPVHAIDIDRTAADSATENSRRNRLAGAIKVVCGDASLIQTGKYDVILANINRNILLEDLSTYSRGMRPDGCLLCSGFYTEDIPLLEKEASRCGLRKVSQEFEDNWAVVRFAKE